MNRRGFLGGLLTTLAAPAIVRTPGLLMPVRVPLLAYPPVSESLAALIELLNRSNHILADMVWREGAVIEYARALNAHGVWLYRSA